MWIQGVVFGSSAGSELRQRSSSRQEHAISNPRGVREQHTQTNPWKDENVIALADDKRLPAIIDGIKKVIR